MAVETPPQPGQLPSSPVVQDRALGTNHRTARFVAIIAGLLGAALALATPFLPVKQTTAQLNWPQNGVLQSVNAPLIGYVATDLTISVPCSRGRGTRRAGERRQDRAAVHGAQAGAQGHRPRPADRTGQQRPARHRPQHTGGQCAAEPGAQPRMRAADVHRARRQGHRRIRRARHGTRHRRSRRAASRRAQRLRLPAPDRRRVHRSGRARAAGPEVLGDPGLALQHLPDPAEARS